jgi:hypothetical protein
MEAGTVLVLVKVAHTVAWALLAGCVVAVPVFTVRGRLRAAAVCSIIVWLEIAVLAANGMTCPLTHLAARYTADRGPAFDIYLPGWLAENNKRIFGTAFVVGELILLGAWVRRRRRAESAQV